jgi:hypothetical protein
MKVNKLGKSFGPAASFAGLLVFVAGLVACFSSPIGVLFALVGVFMAFSDERTSVDLAQRKVRYAS